MNPGKGKKRVDERSRLGVTLDEQKKLSSDKGPRIEKRRRQGTVKGRPPFPHNVKRPCGLSVVLSLLLHFGQSLGGERTVREETPKGEKKQ